MLTSFILNVFFAQNIFCRHGHMIIITTNMFYIFEIYPILMILGKMTSHMKIFTLLDIIHYLNLYFYIVFKSSIMNVQVENKNQLQFFQEAVVFPDLT